MVEITEKYHLEKVNITASLPAPWSLLLCPNNGSVIKGVRLIQSEGQGKLYFAPSIKNLTERSGTHLLQERATLLCFTD